MARKTVAPYRRVTGSGEAGVPGVVEHFGRTRRSRRGPGAGAGAGGWGSHREADTGADTLGGNSETLLEEEAPPSKGSDVFGASEASSSVAGSLPMELIALIASYVPKKFPLLLVNSRWFAVALVQLYARPQLNPHNFFLFVQAISSDRSLGSNVRELDLVRIAQVGEKSMTSRLLRRCSPKLERFIAPQSHFGYLPMISLAGCHRLRVLDLSLVSETVDLPQLFRTIENFGELEVLHFPRSSIDCPADAEMRWAPNLTQLGLSGGFPAQFLERTEFPPSLTHLHISNCPYMTTTSLMSLLAKIGPQLQRLVLSYPIPLLSGTAADSVLLFCPNLKTLHVSIDYVSRSMLEPDYMPLIHPLETLYLISSGMIGHSEKIKPGDVLLATDQLPELRRVSASLLLGWNPESAALMGLVELMNERGGGVWMI